MYSIDWKNINAVIELAKFMGPNTLVVQWPGRDHFNITRYVNNFNHVARMGGKILYATQELR